MTNHQDKELSGDLQLNGGVLQDIENAIGSAAFSEIADMLPKLLATSPQLPVAEQPAGQAVDRWNAVIQLAHKLDDAAQGIYEKQVYGFATEFRVLAGLDGIDAALEAAKRHNCETCNGRGQVGGFVNAENGYQSDPCPDCAAPHSPVAQMSGDEAIERAVSDAVAVGNKHNVSPIVTARIIAAYQTIALHPFTAASHPSNAATQDAPTDHAPYPFLPNGFSIQSNYLHGYRMVNADARIPIIGEWLPTRQAATACAWAKYASQLESAATVPQVVQAPVETHLRSRIADLLHLLEFAKIETPSEGDAQQAIKAMTDIQTILHSAPQPVAASPSIVPSDEQIVQAMPMDIQRSAECHQVRWREFARKVLALTTASNAGEVKP